MFGGNDSNQHFFPNQLPGKSYQFESNNRPLPLQLFGTENNNFDLNSSSYLGLNQPNLSLSPSIPVQNTDNLFSFPQNPNLNCGLNLNPNLNCGLNLNPNLNYGLNSNPNLDCGLNLNPDPTDLRLQLSCNETEQNSYGSLTAGASTEMLNLFDDLRPEFAHHDQELSRLLRVQEKELFKGYLDIKKRHTARVVSSLRRKFEEKLLQKDLELSAITSRNRDLCAKLEQAASEAQQWQAQAWQSESTVNALNEQLRQAADLIGQLQPEIDYEASSVAGDEAGQMGQLWCRKCGVNEALMILIPCRHLALCQWCVRGERSCPVCACGTTHSVQVNYE